MDSTHIAGPNPTPQAAAVWLKNNLDRKYIHTIGWQEINRRYHGLARAVRPYINSHFPPEERESAFDGFTLALMAMAHFEDIDMLTAKMHHVFDQRISSPSPSS